MIVLLKVMLFFSVTKMKQDIRYTKCPISTHPAEKRKIITIARYACPYFSFLSTIVRITRIVKYLSFCHYGAD